jgi:two-component system catabolic regulation response regulator CreB
MSTKILIIEDECGIADTIVYALKTEGFEPLWCATGGEGRRLLEREKPDLVILDVGLPDVNGFELCRELRKTSGVPVIFLTARADEVDRVVGLEIGGDDYVVKPFSPRELTARVRAVLRRSAAAGHPGPQPTTEGATAFAVDEQRMTIAYHRTPLELSRVEFRLLSALLKYPGRVFSRQALMNAAWDDPDVSLERTVDTHIKTLRNKLKGVRPDCDPIETRRGFGYCLRETS